MFSVAHLSKFSIFAMSITPYINASIITQLLTVVIPTLEQWSEEGRRGECNASTSKPLCSSCTWTHPSIGMSYGLRAAYQ